jgi:hypothetical protein
VTNVVPGQYREVSVTRVDFALTDDNLRRHFMGRQVYRRTRYVVVRNGAETAVVGVTKDDEDRLMSVVTGVDTLALPTVCHFLNLPDVDTAVASSLAGAARRHARGARCVVVQGRYEHVSFIIEPSPRPVRVTEVVPPAPAKLVDQAQRVLAMAEGLPPVELVPDVVDIAVLARQRPATRYLLPCRGSGVVIPGADVAFLDERPPRQEWTLIGCARSRALHQWFYGDVPDNVELCPRLRPRPPGTATLTKCCLLEDHNETESDCVVVPWGATLDLVREGLATLASSGTQPWSPE